jgi:hypothetical protein
MFNEFRLEVDVCFVDIGGIVDNHCISIYSDWSGFSGGGSMDVAG